MAPTKTHRRRPITLTLLALLVVGLVLGAATLLAGRVSGREFSPQKFSSRSFHFWEIPFLHLQVTPIRRTSDANSVSNFLLAQNHIQSANDASSTWHLVEIKRGLTSSTPADAEILVSYLELADSNAAFYWRDWSTKHPQAAAVLWPVVQRLATKELYLLTPDLFALAEQESNAQRLQANIDAWLRSAYLELAKDLHAADRPDLAATVLQDALLDYPDHEPARSYLQSLAATP